MIRWLSSASIYGISETVSVYLTETDPVYVNIAKTIIGGATADSMFMRYFHINIDSKIQSPLKRMCIEQVASPKEAVLQTSVRAHVEGYPAPHIHRKISFLDIQEMQGKCEKKHDV